MNRILFTIPVVGGGMGRAVINYATEFSKLGFQISVFLLADNQIDQYQMPNHIKIYPGVKGKYSKFKFFSSLWKLRKLCRQENFDYVLSFSGMHSCYVIMALVGLESKIFAFHRASPYKTYGVINDALNRIFFHRSAGLIVQTQTAKNVFVKKYKHPNIILVPNPVKDFTVDENQKREKIIISVSRLVKGKGLDRLIDVFSKICQRGDNEWRLQIVGEGEYRKTLEFLIKRLKMENKIELLGFQKDVDYFLSRASIFAFASESEGFPNSLLEAMCSGLACISFDCPTGPSEIIIDGVNGFLVELNDTNRYEEKLDLLMKDSALREVFSLESMKLKKKYNSQIIISDFIAKLCK